MNKILLAYLLFALGVFLMSHPSPLAAAGVTRKAVHFLVGPNTQDKQVRFGIQEVESAASSTGSLIEKFDGASNKAAGGALQILIFPDASASAKAAAAYGVAPLAHYVAQAYSLRRKGGGVLVLGADPTGAMYGALDVAESIRCGTFGSLKDADHAPYVEQRGIKFNIPLDARSPSYSDGSDAAQANIPEVWDIRFWQEYLDEMARQRLNVLSLWNLHPFPSMVKVPGYEDVALADVKRTTVPLTLPNPSGKDMWVPEKMGGANLETVKVISINDKIRFWNEVFDYAKARGISVYLFTWNIHTFGVDGKHGITDEKTNAATKDYFRASVKALLTAYPQLAGIGINAGENMGSPTAGGENGQWLADTYGEGVNDVCLRQPNRKLRLIYRMHEPSFPQIEKPFAKFKSTSNFIFETEFKYSWARTYSTPAPKFIDKNLASVPAGQRSWLTARFDDVYNFRWSNPNFVREWVHNLPGPNRIHGFLMGPDGFTWGREFSSLHPDNPRQLVISRWWMAQTLFGRLGYEPELGDSYFESLMSGRFAIPAGTAAKLDTGWSNASLIVPLINRFFWRHDDLRFLPEGCLSASSHFLTVKDFVNPSLDMVIDPPMNEGMISIVDYCKYVKDGSLPAGVVTPEQVAQQLDHYAQTARNSISGIKSSRQELTQTLQDITRMASLGNYYAEKIRGAMDLQLATLGVTDIDHRAAAVMHLKKALEWWKTYAAKTSQQYAPQFLTRVGLFDPLATTPWVAADIALAAQPATAGPSFVQDPQSAANPVTGKSVQLSVLGASKDFPESSLAYYWKIADRTRPAPVVYSANGSNAAKTTTVAFSRSGTYIFQVVVLDPAGKLATSTNVIVEVNRRLR